MLGAHLPVPPGLRPEPSGLATPSPGAAKALPSSLQPRGSSAQPRRPVSPYRSVSLPPHLWGSWPHVGMDA